MAAGHVHAYERSHSGVFKSKRTACAPTYVTIGDGGNREGLSEDYLKKPDWSAVREASFGMGTLTVENGSHAVWRWHRNKDHVAEVGFLIRISCSYIRTQKARDCIPSSSCKSWTAVHFHHAYASFPIHVGRSGFWKVWPLVKKPAGMEMPLRTTFIWTGICWTVFVCNDFLTSLYAI